MNFIWLSVAVCLGIVMGAALAGRRTEIYANALRRIIMLTEPARLQARNKELHIDEQSWIQIRALVREALREVL